jgi:hypothetical protein
MQVCRLQRTKLEEGLKSDVGDGGRRCLWAIVEGPARSSPRRRRWGWRPASGRSATRIGSRTSLGQMRSGKEEAGVEVGVGRICHQNNTRVLAGMGRRRQGGGQHRGAENSPGVESLEAAGEGGAAESSALASAAFLRRGSREGTLLCGATEISRGPNTCLTHCGVPKTTLW